MLRRRRYIKNVTSLAIEAIPEPAQGQPIALWWQDEARVGRQGSLTSIWAEPGSRPHAPRDQGYDLAYISGAVCPARGVGAALALPQVNAEALNRLLAEISAQVAPGAHAVLVLDGAGWHQPGGKLRLPDTISLWKLPPYSPELNPVENIWHFLRHNDFANRVSDTDTAIVDARCSAWNTLIAQPDIAQPDRISSIASREWAEPVNA